jgi:hypothetical protein
MSGQFRQEFGVDGSEQPLNFPAPLRSSHSGINNAKAQTGRNLIEVLAGEVASVIHIQHVRDSADGPGRIALAPDSLPQCKAGIQDGRSAKEHHEACDNAGIII